MKTRQLIAALILLSSLLLASCAPAQPPIQNTLPAATTAPTASQAQTSTTAPTDAAAAPTTTTAPANPAASPVTLNCEDQANLKDGRFRAENNTWGKGTLTGWSQCVGLRAADDGTLSARWTWDWPMSGGNVKAYPEIIFGQKPGGPSTASDLPKQVSSLKELQISYDLATTRTGSGNLAFDFWLTDTANPSTWGVPPIKTEIMIWLESFGPMAPGGSWQEKTTIDGVEYSVYTANHWGDGWDYVAFKRTKPQTGEGASGADAALSASGSINLVSFLSYMKSNNLITGQEYVASVEFGNEVIGGTGDTTLNKFTVSVR